MSHDPHCEKKHGLPCQCRARAIPPLVTLPVATAAQLLGVSVRTVNSEIPVIRKGYRSKCVTVADILAYLDRHESKP